VSLTSKQKKKTNLKKYKKPPKKLTNYKKQVKLAEGLEVAKLKGVSRYKATKQGFMNSIKEHFGKAIDRIDPVETAAILGTTILVKAAIDNTPVLAAKVQSFLEKYPLTPILGVLGLAFGVAPKSTETQRRGPQ
jgi:translation initiation factor 2 alpha subunit (eIF-2alpha)